MVARARAIHPDLHKLSIGIFLGWQKGCFLFAPCTCVWSCSINRSLHCSRVIYANEPISAVMPPLCAVCVCVCSRRMYVFDTIVMQIWFGFLHTHAHTHTFIARCAHLLGRYWLKIGPFQAVIACALIFEREKLTKVVSGKCRALMS